MKKRLTEKLIRETSYNGTVQLLRDPSTPGFMVAINKTTKTYKIQGDLYVGEPGRKVKVKTVRKTIGTVGEMSLKAGRREALKYLSMIKRGIDPNKTYRAVGDEDSSTWTVGEALDQYKAFCKKGGQIGLPPETHQGKQGQIPLVHLPSETDIHHKVTGSSAAQPYY